MGINLGGIFKIVAPIALTVITGGAAAPLAMKTIASQIAMQVLQKMGQEFGLPPSIINMAQTAFAAGSGQPGLAQQGVEQTISSVVGDLARNFNLSPQQEGRMLRDFNVASSAFEEKLSDMMMDRIKSATSEELKEMKAGGGKGQSLIMRLAIALGRAMDDKMEEMAKITDQIGATGDEFAAQFRANKSRMDGFGEVKGKNQARFTALSTENDAIRSQQQGRMGELSGRLQGLSQELSMLSQALTTSIKSMGEANSTLARKG